MPHGLIVGPYLAARRWRHVTAGVGGAMLLVGAVGSRATPIPDLLGGPGLAVPIAVFASLLPVAAVAFALASSRLPIESTAHRAVRGYDVAFVAVVDAVLVAVSWAVGTRPWMLFAKAAVVGTAAVLGGTRLAGGAVASTVWALYLVVASMLGSGIDGVAQPWAFVLRPDLTLGQVGAVVVLTVVGAALHVGRRSTR